MVLPAKRTTTIKRLVSEKDKKKARSSSGGSNSTLKSTTTTSKDSLSVTKDKGKGRVSPAPSLQRSASVSGPDLDVNDSAWDEIYRKTRKHTGKPLIHTEGQNRIEHLLRAFDFNPDFGPCIGLTRLERWERASDLELDPPAEIKQILLTKEGQTEDRYHCNVFYNTTSSLA